MKYSLHLIFRLLDSPEDRIYRRTSLIDDHHPMRIGRVIYFAMAQVEDQVDFFTHFNIYFKFRDSMNAS